MSQKTYKGSHSQQAECFSSLQSGGILILPLFLSKTEADAILHPLLFLEKPVIPALRYILAIT